jgi:hypothetical protein
MWRKNRGRRGLFSAFCVGVDLNRNYDIAFGGASTSSNICSDTYHGGKAFSEPETSSQAKYIMSYKRNGVSRIKFFLSMHTYSQLILLPWSYQRSKPPEYKELESVAIEGNKALFAVDGKEYKIGASAIILYAAAGSASDWTFIKNGPNIKHSYTFELRDKGQHGFVMPQSAIIPTGKETFAAIKVMTKLIYNNDFNAIPFFNKR